MNRRSFLGMAAVGAVATAGVVMTADDHVHRAGDGRGARRVICNGKEVRKAFYADTLNGRVMAYSEPLRIDRATGGVAAYELRGETRVEFI